MTPLDVFNWMMIIPTMILSLGFWLFPVLAVLVGIHAVFKVIVWPALCAFGNWLGRE